MCYVPHRPNAVWDIKETVHEWSKHLWRGTPSPRVTVICSTVYPQPRSLPCFPSPQLYPLLSQESPNLSSLGQQGLFYSRLFILSIFVIWRGILGISGSHITKIDLKLFVALKRILKFWYSCLYLFQQQKYKHVPPCQVLCFRFCGLNLGLRVCHTSTLAARLHPQTQLLFISEKVKGESGT